MMGGDFGQGAALGAWTSAYGFLFNKTLTGLMQVGHTTRLVKMEVNDDGGATVTGEIGGLTSSGPAMARAFAWSYGAVFAGATGALTISLAPEIAAFLYGYQVDLAITGASFLSSWNPGVTPAPFNGGWGFLGGATSVYGSYNGWW
ncbi:MAG: hypothetical protein WAW37_01100 [Syntrophobacteraceae bacterium]